MSELDIPALEPTDVDEETVDGFHNADEVTVGGLRRPVAIPSDPCGTPLPIGPIVDTYTYSQFVTLATIDERTGVTELAVVPTVAAATLAPIIAEADPEATISDLVGGVALLSAERDVRLAQTVQVENTDQLLATRHLEIDGHSVPVSLDPRAVELLLAGRPAVVAHPDAPGGVFLAISPGSASKQDLPAMTLPGGNDEGDGGNANEGAEGGAAASPFLRLEPPEAGQTPTHNRFHIVDLAAFLADPALPAAGGGQIRVQVDADTVQTLRRGDSAHVALSGDRSIELIIDGVRPAPTAEHPTLDAVSPLGDEAPLAQRLAPSAIPGMPVTIASAPLALWLPWIQQWKLTGYARGELLSTVALGPQEETKIEIYSWNRHSATVERSSSVDTEDNVELSDTTHSSTDVVKDVTKSSQFTLNAGLNVGVKVGSVVNIGGNATANWQNSTAEVTKTTTDFVHDTSVKSAANVKQSRQVKVTETSEVGREDRVTRTLRNPNMCHSLNLDYFEVLGAWKVETKLDASAARLVVLLDNPLRTAFDRAAVRQYEKTLRRALMDRSLVDGFAAARLLDAYTRACAFASERCLPTTTPAAADGEGTWLPLLSVIKRVAQELDNSPGISIKNEVDNVYVSGKQEPKNVRWAHQWEYYTALRAAAPSLYQALEDLVAAPAVTPELAARLEVALAVSGGLDAIQPAKLQGEQRAAVKQTLDNIFLIVVGAKPENSSPYLLPLQAHIFPYSVLIQQLGLLDGYTDDGLVVALAQFASARKDAAAAAGAAAAAAAVQAAARADLATDAVRSTFDLWSLTTAAEREAALLSHLAGFADHYRFQLYNALVGTAAVTAVDQLFVPGFIEPWAIGYFGGKLAFPVRAHYAEGVLKTLLINNALLEGQARCEDVLLPTPAVTCETRLGACGACEPFIEKSRDVDLRTRTAQAALTEAQGAREQAEADRYHARLAQKPPQLTDPTCCKDGAIHVVLEHASPHGGPATVSERPS